jgi:DTW domain-containing protein YfiP
MPHPLAEHRCPRCEIRKPLCFCDAIPCIATRTRLVIIMHPSEMVLTTNTARLATKALANSEIRIRGHRERMSTAGLAPAGMPSLLLYPDPRAAELNASFAAGLAGPVNLIVPDGSWSQTRKIVRREPALTAIGQVRLPAGPPSQYRLRSQPSGHSLCTLEAIARALGILESVEVQEQLEALLRVMVERTLWSRGMLAARDCTTGQIPRAAFAG